MDTFHEKTESLIILKSANCVRVKVQGVSTVLQLYVLKKTELFGQFWGKNQKFRNEVFPVRKR